MASRQQQQQQALPPRRLPPQESTFEASRTESAFPSTLSESQNVVLNNPQSTIEASSSQPAVQIPSEDVRRCWICQGDETEDLPENSAWRTPCPCSLTAHDRCLLEWISNEEAPKPGEIAHNHTIKCPQCKAEYKISRPRDYLVAVVDLIQKAARGMILPAGFSAVLGCVYSGFFVYGLNAMQMVFGSEETRRMLAPAMRGGLFEAGSAAQRLSRMMQTMDPFFPTEAQASLQLMFGLPLIAPSLILLRTNLADQAFALLLPLYFLKQSNRSVTHWPPTPGLALATIPYIRTAYNELYRYTFSSLEAKWDAAVQRKPREGETAEQIAAAAAEEDGRAIFELEFINEDEENPRGNNRRRNNRRQRANNNNQNAVPAPGGAGNNVAAPAPNENAQANNLAQAQQAQADQQRWEIRQNVPTGHIITTVMGALFFPAISSIMGDVLKYSLPPRFVENTFHHARFSGLTMKVASRGLLKERWGRSIVGGCLFVVLKDMITLYCKWRKARDFGKRKVLDYVGKRGSSSV